jgi:hypothetical protein
MRPLFRYLVAAAAISGLAILMSCSEDVYTGQRKFNVAPTVRLTNGPIEGETTCYRVHFYWLGYDSDGTVAYYEYILVSGDPLGFDPADTTGVEKWTKTTETDRLFVVKADEFDTMLTINKNPYARFDRTHTFFIRSVDDLGKRSIPVHRSFTAYTFAPYVYINFPVNPNPGSGQVLSHRINFRWYGRDPISSPWNSQDVDSIRYMHFEYNPYTIDSINATPERYEHWWSPWIYYNAPNDSGKSTLLGDDEILEPKKNYVFAVQAMDEAGAVTPIIDLRTNARKFLVIDPPGPVLTVNESHLGIFKIMGTNFKPSIFDLVEGFPLKFTWSADASDYGGIITSYRYGWDIADLTEPEEWDVSPSPYHFSAPEKRFYSGTHIFYIEVIDNMGIMTLAKIQIDIFQILMDKNLLLVDDFNSGEFAQVIYAMPTEREHDEFWTNICLRADGFDPEVDIYDSRENFYIPVDQQTIWRYKNIVWVYSAEDRTMDNEGTTWIKLCQFIPPSAIGYYGSKYNYLQSYLSFGGHVWTSGKSDREGGMGGLMTRLARAYPRNLACEITSLHVGCDWDTTGVHSMPYKEYCITVLDRVWGAMRPDPRLENLRDFDNDALSHGWKDNSDPITAAHPDLPDTLDLWWKVVRPGMFFDPQVRGFHYVELYDTQYWLDIIQVGTQSCLHPIFRMRARNTRSNVDNAIFAFWTTKNAHVVADAPGAIAAPSVHFGIPLWFFERDDVNAIADVIFKEWGISNQP